jgi:hypothetical protein
VFYTSADEEGVSMTISSLPISTNQPVTNTDVSMAVLAKNLDTVRKAGEGMVKMMEQSVNPGLGKNIDTTI